MISEHPHAFFDEDQQRLEAIHNRIDKDEAIDSQPRVAVGNAKRMTRDRFDLYVEPAPPHRKEPMKGIDPKGVPAPVFIVEPCERLAAHVELQARFLHRP